MSSSSPGKQWGKGRHSCQRELSDVHGVGSGLRRAENRVCVRSEGHKRPICTWAPLGGMAGSDRERPSKLSAQSNFFLGN